MGKTREELTAERQKLDAEIAALGEEKAEKKEEAKVATAKATVLEEKGDIKGAEAQREIARMSDASAATLADLLRKDIALREGKKLPGDPEPEKKSGGMFRWGDE
jgi:hypothetical protein